MALDERNKTLAHCLRGTGIPDVRQWGDLFSGRAGFSLFSHQQWVTWIRAHDSAGQWTDWQGYVESTYGY